MRILFSEFIKTPTRKISDNLYPLPSPLYKVLDGLDASYLYWDYYQQTYWIKKKGNTDHLVYAGALHALSQHSFFSTPIGLTLAVKCILDLLHGHAEVYKRYLKLKATVINKYPLYKKVQWKKQLTAYNSPFTTSILIELQVQSIYFMQYVFRIIKCTFYLFTELFKLSKRYREAYLLAQFDSYTSYQSLSEGCATYHTYFKRLKKDRVFCLEQIKKNKDLIDSLLTTLQSKKTAYSIVNSLSQKIKTVTQKGTHVPSFLKLVGKDLISPFYQPGVVTGMTFEFKPNFLDPYLSHSLFNSTSLDSYSAYPQWQGKAICVSLDECEYKKPQNEHSSPLKTLYTLIRTSQIAKNLFTN